MNCIEPYKQTPTKMKYRVSALINNQEGYKFLLEMWGDIRIKMFLNKSAHFFMFNNNDEAIALLKEMINAFGDNTEEYKKLINRLKIEKLIPANEQKPVLYKGDYKAVINGKIYDTKKAIFIKEELKNGNNIFNFVYKRFFITPKGNKFVVIQAGANTKYGIKINKKEKKGNILIKIL